MRAWPPLQLLIALGFLTLSAFALYTVVGSRPQPGATEAVVVFSPVEGFPVRQVRITVDSTASVQLTSARWGDQEIPFLETGKRSWSFEHPVEIEAPLRIAGTVTQEELPVALRIQIDVQGQPIRQEFRWINSPSFRVVLHPEPKKNQP